MVRGLAALQFTRARGESIQGRLWTNLWCDDLEVESLESWSYVVIIAQHCTTLHIFFYIRSLTHVGWAICGWHIRWYHCFQFYFLLILFAGCMSWCQSQGERTSNGRTPHELLGIFCLVILVIGLFQGTIRSCMTEVQWNILQRTICFWKKATSL
jgi:hypothetical protein